MPENGRSEYLAECFWPGVHDAELELLDDRRHSVVADLVRSGKPIRYLGSMLVCIDDVVLCLFEGAEQTVHEVVERAQVPFERLLETVRSPWPKVVR